MAASKEEILESVALMSAVELMELVKAIEERFEISAASAYAPAIGATLEEEEQTEYCVLLSSNGPNRVAVIKAVRELTGFGLKEAKDLSDVAYEKEATVKRCDSKDEAMRAVRKLEEAGAKARWV